MQRYDDHPVLITHPALGSNSAVDRTISKISFELDRLGLTVITATTSEDVEFAITANSGIGAALVGREPGTTSDRELLRDIERLHRLHEDLPVVLLGEHGDVEEIPVDVAAAVQGFFWLQEDTPRFVAGRVERLVAGYVDHVMSPFFGALRKYVDESNWVWSCPGHNGGMFYRKTPLGRMFFDYVGEDFLRGDLCNASPELGSILQHQGPVLDAEKRAAEIFGAERTYFVLNGTSTSNKIVTMGLLAPGDLVLFDRNCHKSMHHGALMMSGAIPIYLNPTRDANGIIGPVDHAYLDEDYIREQIRSHPLVTDPDAWRRPRPFRMAILTNTTYDGVCYNAREVLDRIGRLCDYLVYDEAWMAYAKFHPLYADRFGMDLDGLTAADPGIITTQSTHKCLAGMSQASQIHVRDSHIAGQPRCTDHDRFNEIFMMHTSTSPQYNMIASLDVGAEMMRGRRGFALMDDAIRESIALRKQIERYHDELAAGRDGAAPTWFFDMFGPHTVTVTREQLEAAMIEPFLDLDTREALAKAAAEGGYRSRPWREVPDSVLATVPECWMFHEHDDWHDLTGLTAGYVMLDPTKLSIATPGIVGGRQFDSWGIPAAIPAAILREKGIVAEKTSFYTILLLVTAAVERGKSATLLSELFDLKRMYDDDVPLRDALPAIVSAHPERYGHLTLPGLCAEMHEFLRANGADELQRKAYGAAHEPEIGCAPAEGHASLIRGEVDLLPLSDIADREAASLVVVYPPGIALQVPGERYAPDSAAVEYLRLFEENDNRFPGFENEMQGIFPTVIDGNITYRTYVRRS